MTPLQHAAHPPRPTFCAGPTQDMHGRDERSFQWKTPRDTLFSTTYLLKFTMRSIVAALSLSTATATSSVPNFREHFEWATEYAEQYVATNGGVAASEYPYWNFIPDYILSLPANGDEVTWESRCYASNTGSITISEDKISVSFSSSNKMSPHCSEEYVLLTTTIFSVKKVDSDITSWELELPSDHTDAEDWDLQTKGLRVFLLRTDSATSMANVLKTVELFAPLATVAVDPKLAELNAEFMAQYPQFPMKKFDSPLFSPPAASDIKNGDMFFILRLDGLNTMLAWAMGSTTGHVTTALWIDDELFILESEGEVSYWPNHGVMKTPYENWLQQAQAADDNVVWVPLSEEARANYDATAALKYFNSVEGLEYGYWTQIWGWIDTENSNFPCLPPDYSNCMSWELFEPLLAVVDRSNPASADVLWNDGLNLRLGTQGLRTADAYQEAASRGMTTGELIQIPEQDTWRYNMTTSAGEAVQGRSMVCCVFACSMWKNAGVFGEIADDVNCEEFTNFDDYVLTAVSEKYQQIMGSYSLELNGYRTRDPYAHMAEKCASTAPGYEKEDGC